MAMRFGTTFSEPYVESLGLRPGEVYDSLIHELGLQLVRLCAYWDGTERHPGRFEFGSLDWQVDEATKAGLDIILTVGQKAPRWPEFYVPAWTSRRDPSFEQHLLRFVEVTVRHFREAPISVWQVENESYIGFGGPRIDDALLRREIELVRRLDGRPIMLTESSGKRDWRRAARWCDVLGVNLYTRVWRRHWTNLFLGGYVDIAAHAFRYNARLRTVSPSVQEVIVAELQAEPWGPKPVTELTPAEAAETMMPERLRRNVELAANAGFSTVLLWGAEWWYWLQERGDDSMWEAARAVVRELGDSPVSG